MKRNTAKLISCLMLVAMLVSVFAGCGKQEAETTPTSDPEAGNAPTETVTHENQEPIKIAILPEGFADGFSEGSISHQWQQMVEEACNVEIEWILPASGAYEDTLQLVLLQRTAAPEGRSRHRRDALAHGQLHQKRGGYGHAFCLQPLRTPFP